ncbi:MAG: DUF4139 domain-containing protein, partial [Kofleriaceae bacterium]
MDGASLDARLEHVTLYASGARVRRVTTVAAPVPTRVRIVGLPLSVIDDTVRVEVEGGAIATTVRAGVDVPVAHPDVAEDPPEIASAKQRASLAEAEVDRLTGALERTEGAPIVEHDPSEQPPAAWAAVVAARRAVIALRTERERVVRDQLAAARRAAGEARRALTAVLDREHRAGTAKPAKLHELRKFVDVDLVPEPGVESVTIHLEYLVAAARWAPSYVARIEGDKVGVEVRAVVAQATGEDWVGVPLWLSTAEPTRFAALPELHAQRIGRRQQPPGRQGFRAPPTGADQLYADFDRERPPLEGKSKSGPTDRGGIVSGRQLEQTTTPYGGQADDLESEVWDEDSSAAKQAFQTPSGFAAAPAQSAPAPPARMMLARSRAPEAKTTMRRAAAPTDQGELAAAFDS